MDNNSLSPVEIEFFTELGSIPEKSRIPVLLHVTKLDPDLQFAPKAFRQGVLDGDVEVLATYIPDDLGGSRWMRGRRAIFRLLVTALVMESVFALDLRHS